MKIVASVLLLLVACHPLPDPQEPNPPEPTPVPDRPDGSVPPEPEPVPATDCRSVCAHYEKLDCIEAKPTAEGHPCAEVCENMRDSPLPGLEAYYQCVVTTQSCDQARACH